LCSEEDCPGAPVLGGPCLGHLDNALVSNYLANLKPGDDINARGTSISPELLSKLLVKNVLAPAGGRRFNFAHAKFTGDAYFTHVAFTGDADFSGAEFVGFADFQYATFAGRANFYGTQFNGSTAFVDVKFNGQANLSTSKFTGDVSFVNAIFAGDADFSGARFTDRVGDSRDVGSVSFVNAVFAGDANFTGAHFNRGANFCKASFHRRCMIGPVHADLLRLASATFDEKSEVHCDGLEINADDIRALRGMTMSARGGDISISAAVFGGPTTIAPSPIDMEENELWPTLLETRRLRGPGETRPPALAAPPPKLLTVAGADVTNLTVSGLDLSRCKFLGASNLDRLRIDGAPRFAETPAGRGWIRRLTIAEEHEWRARYDRRPQGWSGAEHRQSGSESRSRVPQLHSTEARYLEAARIQVVYRELRKGREDARDEPGAADFYYGEMEMRRLAIPGLRAHARISHVCA
jgi:uncharacterized protein YjbI with pentapeptide repeats